MNSSIKPKPMSIWMAILFFGLAAIVLYLATHYIIPFLIINTNIHPALSWFIVGGIVVFLPLFITAVVATRQEGAKTFYTLKNRLRLNSMNRRDWLWTLVGFIVIIMTAGLIMLAGEWATEVGLISSFNISPSFLDFEPFGISQPWMFLIWLPMFFFNIMGEELLWRGYILPRQELAYGKYAWIINSALWTMFHIPFGWSLIMMLIPTFIIIPYIVQERKNTWIGVILHVGINGPGFIAVALGLAQ